MHEIRLESLNWKVKGFWPWVPIKGTSMELGQELMGVTDWLPATVPGGVHYDLYRAGLITHPYTDLNSTHCEWVENRWWMYKTTIERPNDRGERVELVFKGLDYEAAIYANQVLLGEHKGMFHEAVYDMTELLKQNERVELSVLLRHAPDEMAQIGKTSETFTQKSRFNYKWDFSTRLVNIGIWDEVVLRVQQAHSLGEVYLHTDIEGLNSGSAKEAVGIIGLKASVLERAAAEGEGEHLLVSVSCFDPEGRLVASQSASRLEGGQAEVELRIGEPELWYPNGYGSQPLYQVKVVLHTADGTEYDEKTYKTGLRKLSYAQNDESPDDALPYTVVINNKRIYIRGVNMTPLDHLYGNVTDEQYGWMVRLMRQGNMNMVRIWGGGVIEKTAFYELCDANGIMVWQEFIQSSSGVDNIPSKRPEFLALLEQTARAALADRRNHVSLTVWSGGNELMSAPNKPSNDSDENLAMLKELVRQLDPHRLFLPTSASGPVEYITDEKGLGHDVHGHWKYMNNPEHYRLYGENDNLFHSEFGVDGVSRVKSLRKFLSETHRTPVSMQDSMVWRHHGEWWDTLSRDEALFGTMENLAIFSESSQWVQAEGLRFILEANRRRKFRNSGSIIWQLNEPWPNVSCTNLIDYFGETKMAYYWAKQAFAPVHVSLDYRKLNAVAGEAVQSDIYVHAHQAGLSVEVTAQVLDSTGAVHHQAELIGVTAEDTALCVGQLKFSAPSTANGLLFIRLTYRSELGSGQSHPYVFSASEGPLYQAALSLNQAKLAVDLLQEWQPSAQEGMLENEASITNTGEEVALHVHLEEQTNGFWLESDDQYFTLFPGETRKVAIRCLEKAGGGFLKEDTAVGASSAVRPVLLLRSFPNLVFPVS
ncbi:glycoside hydrolase family 2 protein [Paenibacillus paridis]|uniref:glycoside hydrolase family 2 protein n=1 Tax=Paenibacillus paridis TaxID=2583376 RepID=UPI00111EAD07|nr:glycoside hydrolase family 2 TIM barrel-domain containing protein [Paenibacillus paridis]